MSKATVHVPVDGVDSVLDAIRSPDTLKQWLENLDAANIEKTQQETGDANAHTIGENMVRNLGMTRFPAILDKLQRVPDPATGEPPHAILRYPTALLDNIIHLSELDKYRLECEDYQGLPRVRRQVFEYLNNPDTPVDPGDFDAIGGTDAAIYGGMGRGKSTFLTTMVARILEINNEAVVWRGTSARTEWLPLAPWATVVLPKGVDATVTLAPPNDDGAGSDMDFEPIKVDLERIVRDVKYYDGLTDLNHNVLERGGFHVVYPDPRFRECEEVTKRATETKVLEYTSPWEAHRDDELGAEDITPEKFWWFAWAIHHVSEGLDMPVSWFADEIKALWTNGAEKADQDHPRFIRALADKYVDVRRSGLSIYAVGHILRKHFHHKIRDYMRWGVTMSGTPNPHNEDILSGRAPMTRDYTSGMPKGKALFWNVSSQSFSEFDWDDIPQRHKVPGKLRITYPGVEEVKEAC